MTTTRAGLGLLAGAVVVTGLSAFSTTASAYPASLAEPLHTQQLFVPASMNIGLFAPILGVRSFTDEFRPGWLAGRAVRAYAPVGVSAPAGGKWRDPNRRPAGERSRSSPTASPTCTTA